MMMLLSTVVRRRLVVVATVNRAAVTAATIRPFSSTTSRSIPFRPRRKSSKEYPPLKPRTPKVKGPVDPNTAPNTNLKDNPIVIGQDYDPSSVETAFGPLAGDAIRHSRQKGGLLDSLDIESELRHADYMTSTPGTTEDLVGERRALALGLWEDENRQEWMDNLDTLMEEERVKDMELGDDDVIPEEKTTLELLEQQLEEEEGGDPNTLVHGDWAESVIQVDRVQKVQRGGTMVRYRTLLIGGNGQGVAGFGVAKANTPAEATTAASRHCKRNIFFLDRYQNTALTRSLAGRHNSCRVVLRSVPPSYGLTGHELVREILTLLGVTDCSAKTHGNRNPYNVVRATFKAIMTHESMEDIALKRGKRLLHLERVKRLQI